MIEPRNAAPTTTRLTESHSVPPASIPAATRPTRPIRGPGRSSQGGRAVGPPARRRTDTTRAAAVATSRPAVATSRTQTGSVASPMASELAASRPQVMRSSQP